MWYNFTADRAINCTRAKLPATMQSPGAVASSWVGYYDDPTTKRLDGTTPCSFVGAGMGQCDLWQYMSRFGCGPAGKQQIVDEPLDYRIKTVAGHNSTIAAMNNSIIYPASCQPDGKRKATWALVDYTKGWTAAPPEKTFAVPHDSDCPLMEQAMVMHHTLRLATEQRLATVNSTA